MIKPMMVAKATLDHAERLHEQADDLWFRLHDIQARFGMFTPPYGRIRQLKAMCNRRSDRRRIKAALACDAYFAVEL